MRKTVVALYNNFSTARAAVEDLVSAGFLRDNISLVANDAKGELANYVSGDHYDVKADEGAGFGAVIGTLLGLGAAIIPGIGPVIAAGPLAAILTAGIGAAAGAATGGIAAALIDFGVDEDAAERYATGVAGGGALVSVSAEDFETTRVESILNAHNPVNVRERNP